MSRTVKMVFGWLGAQPSRNLLHHNRGLQPGEVFGLLDVDACALGRPQSVCHDAADDDGVPPSIHDLGLVSMMALETPTMANNTELTESGSSVTFAHIQEVTMGESGEIRDSQLLRKSVFANICLTSRPMAANFAALGVRVAELQ